MQRFYILFMVCVASGGALKLKTPSGLSPKLSQLGGIFLKTKAERLYVERAAPLFQDTNELVDKMLQIVDQYLLAKNLDPHEFTEGSFMGFHYNGWIGNFSSMERLGDASLNTTENTKYLSTQIQMTNLIGNFSYWFKVLGIKVEGGAIANVQFVTVQLNLSFITDPATKKVKAYVDDFHIITIGPVIVHINGLEPLDYLADMVADVIANLVKYLLPILMDEVIKENIQEVLDNIFS